ncbi:nitroreductase family protein [Candidatus Woesearchaeota archaeon]|nr:nitroreductase family protein [Candidatus Woesearchaeota archaeon]
MDVFEAFRNRRSIRKYLDLPVEWDKIGSILDAGRLAPSSGNLQTWKFIAVRDLNKRKQLAEASAQQYWMEQAPVHIVIVGVFDKHLRFFGERGKNLYVIQDCAMAAMQMMLAAHALGLGSCFVSAINEERVGEIILIRGNARPMGILTIGYPAEQPKMPLRYRIENIVYLEVDAGRAYVQGYTPGRIADFDQSISNWRLAERGIKYVKQAAQDIDRITKEKRKGLLHKLIEKAKSGGKGKQQKEPGQK